MASPFNTVKNEWNDYRSYELNLDLEISEKIHKYVSLLQWPQNVILTFWRNAAVSIGYVALCSASSCYSE